MVEGKREFFPDEEPEQTDIYMNGWGCTEDGSSDLFDYGFGSAYPTEEQRIREAEEANGSPDGGKNYPIRQMPPK